MARRDGGPPAPPATPASPAPQAVPNYITPAGFKRLTDELDRLRSVDRRKVVQEVSDAAAQGDRSENAEYIYGKRKLREIDRRMRWLTKRIDAAVVTDPRAKRGDKIYFGATVALEDADGETQELQLVGEDEIDVARGRISWRSPIGAALLGRSLDDEVRVKTPSGVRVFTVTDVRYE
jgi:transcription elongation factor GreB